MASAGKAHTGALGASTAKSRSHNGLAAVKHLTAHLNLTDSSDDSDTSSDSSESDSSHNGESGSDSECEPPVASSYKLPQNVTMNGTAGSANKSRKRRSSAANPVSDSEDSDSDGNGTPRVALYTRNQQVKVNSNAASVRKSRMRGSSSSNPFAISSKKARHSNINSPAPPTQASAWILPNAQPSRSTSTVSYNTTRQPVSAVRQWPNFSAQRAEGPFKKRDELKAYATNLRNYAASIPAGAVPLVIVDRLLTRMGEYMDSADQLMQRKQREHEETVSRTEQARIELVTEMASDMTEMRDRLQRVASELDYRHTVDQIPDNQAAAVAAVAAQAENETVEEELSEDEVAKNDLSEDEESKHEMTANELPEEGVIAEKMVEAGMSDV